jgi:hypothetical protein
MTVNELISELQKVKNKDTAVQLLICCPKSSTLADEIDVVVSTEGKLIIEGWVE